MKNGFRKFWNLIKHQIGEVSPPILVLLAIIIVILVVMVLPSISSTSNNMALSNLLTALDQYGYSAYASSSGNWNVTGDASVSGNISVTGNIQGATLNGNTIPSSNIVGLTDGQTLTNKTLTSPTITNGIFSGTQIIATANVTTLNAPTGRNSTYIIAASDAPTIVKAQADYVCTGTNDGNQINTQIAAELPLGLGKVHFSTGTFDVSDETIDVDVAYSLILEGEGDSTIFDGGGIVTPITIGAATMAYHTVIRDLQIKDGNPYGILITSGDQGLIDNVYIENSTTDAIRGTDMRIFQITNTTISTYGVVGINIISGSGNTIGPRNYINSQSWTSTTGIVTSTYETLVYKNTLETMETGVNISGNSGQGNIQVEDNYFEGLTTGISVANDLREISIKNNLFSGGSEDRLISGITFGTGITNVHLENNRFVSLNVSGINYTGSPTDNVIFLGDFQFPTTDGWAYSDNGVILSDNLTSKVVYIPISGLNPGDLITGYTIRGDMTSDTISQILTNDIGASIYYLANNGDRIVAENIQNFPIGTITSFTAYLAKNLSPTGTYYVKVWNTDTRAEIGTLGSGNAALLTESFAPFTFTNPVVISAVTNIDIGIEFTGSNQDNDVIVKFANSNAWADGTLDVKNSSNEWTNYPWDLSFSLTEVGFTTLDCQLIRANQANPITTTNLSGGAITQIGTDGNFSSSTTLTNPETITTGYAYKLKITGTTGETVTNQIEVIGTDISVIRQ